MPVSTRIFLIRHALVEAAARRTVYGANDVALCEETLARERPAHAWLARRLPAEARWYCTPLARTRATAMAIFAAGYPEQELTDLPHFVEQHLGEWQGLTHEEFTAVLSEPPHPFWDHAADEKPPGGESLSDVVARVGPTLEAVADENEGGDAVIVAHGGSIRAALAHACNFTPYQALQFSVKNLSVTRLERQNGHWKVGCVNEEPPLF
ncbi:histidine phosphatase family protein [Roseomonas xinghualingensis]|uniref:histidine phosphatase family protein n=1 Tax=Roseomonas xinghualingensis TaxID=2986475 RepID=UPI0021F204CB|nr:histidine phosphatase family protein [Roseomonas sp. SXEYE001]MCV4206635.1 histidine phosphatase family protein [Roseomonas sp. SXEYE001]